MSEQAQITSFITKVANSDYDITDATTFYCDLPLEQRPALLTKLISGNTPGCISFLTHLLEHEDSSIMTQAVSDLDTAGGSEFIIPLMKNCLGKRNRTALLIALVKAGTLLENMQISRQVRDWLPQVEPRVRQVILDNIVHVDRLGRVNTLITLAMSDDPDLAHKAREFLENCITPRDTAYKIFALSITSGSLKRWLIRHLLTISNESIIHAIRQEVTAHEKHFIEIALEVLRSEGSNLQAEKLAQIIKEELTLLKGGKFILIFSKSFQERLTLSRVLSPEYNIFEAESHQAALDILQHESPDLIIFSSENVDSEMSLMKTIRADYHQMPVILTFDEQTQHKKNLAASFNITDFLISPWSPEELLTNVESILCAIRKHQTTQKRLTLFNKGDCIFKEGELGDICYIIRKGTVHISEIVEGIGDILLAELGPGDIFGEMSLIDGTYRSASAIAVEDLELITIQRCDLEHLIYTDHTFAVKLVQMFSKRLKHANQLLESMLATTEERK